MHICMSVMLLHMQRQVRIAAVRSMRMNSCIVCILLTHAFWLMHAIETMLDSALGD